MTKAQWLDGDPDPGRLFVRCIYEMIRNRIADLLRGAADQVEDPVEDDLLSSTAIGEVIYNRRSHDLEIDFRDGSAYVYHGVPQGVHDKLLAAPSPGRFYNRQIKGMFDSERVRLARLRRRRGHLAHV